MPFATMRQVLFCLPVEENDVVSKLTQNVTSGIYGQEQQHANYHHHQQGLLPNMLQAPQLEFVTHNIACAPNPYYGTMMAGYGPPLVPPRFVEAPSRMLLAHEVTQELVYVNAKQYHAIQRRRESRKTALERKLVKDRKPYLHESRHQHAMTGVRGTGGRFGNRSEASSLKNTTGSGCAETPRGRG